MKCIECSQDYPDPVWPKTRGKGFCSKPCRLAAWNRKTFDKRMEKARNWAETNRDKSREAKRAWKKRNPEWIKAWGAKHSKRLYQAALKRDPLFIQKVTAREQSRKILLAARPKACESPAPHEGPIECHHRDENPLNTDITNLEWVCRAHHRGSHPESRHYLKRSQDPTDASTAPCAEGLPTS